MLSYSYEDSMEEKKKRVEGEFTQYAIENNLNITLNYELMKFESTTDSYANFKSFVESSLKKNNSKTFDIYVYDMRYTDIYGPYLLNLKDNLSNNYISMYNSKIMEEMTIYNEKLVGFVILIYK